METLQNLAADFRVTGFVRKCVSASHLPSGCESVVMPPGFDSLETTLLTMLRISYMVVPSTSSQCGCAHHSLAHLALDPTLWGAD